MRTSLRALRISLLCAGVLLTGTAFAVEANLEANASSLSAGFGTQDSQLLLLKWVDNAQSLTQLLIERKRAFGERASIVSASHAWDASELDRVSVALAASDASTIAARWRVDGQYSRKLGASREVVASLGAFVSSTADGHRDRSAIASAAWYFAERQVVEGGVRIARSDPGAQTAVRAFAVYHWGTQGQDTLSVRAEAGREAYQSLGGTVAVADFASQELALTWRRWLAPGVGFGVNAAAYANPTYRKTTLGVVGFFDF